MKLESPHQVAGLVTIIGQQSVRRLELLLRDKHTVWFIGDESTARSEPDLTDDERASALHRLSSSPWTFILR